MDRLEMSQVREILRLLMEQKLSARAASRSLGVSASTVLDVRRRAALAALSWSEAESRDEATLAAQLYPPRARAEGATERIRPDPMWMHTEMRKPGVTLELLHLEYLRSHPGGYQYTSFASTYRKWLKKRGVVMRQLHKAGEKAFVDYSGKKPRVICPQTGAVHEVELFVMVLGASNLTYAEATETQTVGDFIASHVRALDYIGGVPRILVPDQLRSAISEPSRYEPTVHRSYAEFGRHYGTAIIPARPRKPRDKAKVEVAVQIVQRWVLACVRNETFFSISALNTRIRELVDLLNHKPMKSQGGVSRRALFERVEQAALSPLPTSRFEISEWMRVTVNLDYHISVANHFYSVPFTFARESLEVRLTNATIEAFFAGKRVASHARSDIDYAHTTDTAHMPEAHRAQFFGADVVLAWAATVGTQTAALVARLLDVHPIREQGWRSAKGLQRLERAFGRERLEQACARGLELGVRSYKPIERLLKLGREAAPQATDAPTFLPPVHANVRGPAYFH